MNAFEEVDVEAWAETPASGDYLGVFVHHPDPDGRVNAETMAFAAGAEYTLYPVSRMPRLVESGHVRIDRTGMTVTLGRIRIISPAPVKREEVEHLTFAVVFLTDGPFSGPSREEKVWLAARVPLVFSEEENV